MTFSLATAVRGAVERIAPQECGHLDDVLAAWGRGDLAYQRGRRRSAAGSVGFGVDVNLVAETVVAVVSGAAAEVLGAVATDAWQRRRRWRSGSRRAVERPAAERPLALTAGQADRLRDACRRHGRTLGLSEEQAALLADAVHGSVDRPDGW